MSVDTVLVIAALVFALLDFVEFRGVKLLNVSVILLCIALLT